MPLYDVKCRQCGKEFEAFAKIAEREDVVCECKGRTTILITTHNNFETWLLGTWQDLPDGPDGKPIKIQSRRHLKEVCRQYGVIPQNL